MAEGYQDIGIKWKQVQVTTDQYGGFLLKLADNGINRIVSLIPNPPSESASSDQMLQKYRYAYNSTYIAGYIVTWEDVKVVNTTVNLLIGYV